MIIDAFAKFTGGSAAPGNNDGVTDSPTTGAQTSSFQLDIGIGSATNPAIPSSAAGGGARDLGIGDDPALKLMVDITVTFTGGTSLGINLQGAPDNGSGAPGAFTTMYTGPVVAVASMIQGTRMADVDLPRQVPGQPLPRYLQLAYAITGTFGAGKLEAALVLDRNDQPYQANAFSGGYPPGIVIAN